MGDRLCGVIHNRCHTLSGSIAASKYTRQLPVDDVFCVYRSKQLSEHLRINGWAEIKALSLLAVFSLQKG